MDAVYGSKKYFQNLGTVDNDYYIRHSPSNRVMQTACSSYQNTIGRHSTIGPYSHLTGNQYAGTSGCNNDFSYTSQYGYNSWGMWRDSRNLTPSSTYSSKSRSSLKSFTIILMTAAFIVILAVLSVAALAFYFSTFKSDDSIMIFDGRFQVTRGDVFTTGLKYNHTSAYQQKVEYYRNLITESLEHNGLTVYKCDIHGFGTGPLVQVDFRVYLDMRKVPMTIRSVEEHIKDSLLKEIMSSKSTKGIAIDLPTLEIKRSLDADVLKSASFVREMVTTPPSIMFDDKITRKISSSSSSSTIISKSPPKSTTSKPKSKQDIVEPEIDIESVPILQGSFEVTKTDADITEKKVRTSTLKPFTITNGSVRMKPKKTTVEKVRPLPKVPENPTANILKLDNVTRPFQSDPATTSRPITTSTNITKATSTETVVIPLTTMKSLSPTFATKKEVETFASSTAVPSQSTTADLSLNKDVSASKFKGEMHSPIETIPKGTMNAYPSTIILDDHPWLPIQPGAKPNNHLLIDQSSKPQTSSSSSNPIINNTPEPFNFQSLARNKPRNPTGSIPPIYQSYNNPALIYAPHEVERLGNINGVRPYPIPIDLIGDQFEIKRNEGLVLNKGEILNTDKKTQESSLNGAEIKTTSVPPIEIIPTLNSNETIELNLEETTEKGYENRSELNIDERVGSQQVGEILLDLLKESNAKLNDSDKDELRMESRTSSMSTPDLNISDSSNKTGNMAENDHTEAIDEIATVLSSIETLSFKNIKDYIMATTKSFAMTSSTEHEGIIAIKDNPLSKIDSMIKSDRVAIVAQSTPANVPHRHIPNASSKENPPMSTSTPTYVAAVDSVDNEQATTSYVEVETVQYTPENTWNAALFPIQSKWEYVNGSLVYPSSAPMRKVYNETLQAWIIENPTETTDRLPPIDVVKNNSESLKNISSIFDTLASKLDIAPKTQSRLPPIMSHFTNKKENVASIEYSTTRNVFMPTPPMKRKTQVTSATLASSILESDDELPLLLSQNTESNFGSSSEAIGQAEIEEVDPTQYEQMLLIDRVSAALRPSSTAPSLITLMPVKSNSGIRSSFHNEKLKGSARGFPAQTQNKRRIEDTSYVIRTNINISS